MALLRTVEKWVEKQKIFCGRQSAMGKVVLVMQSQMTKSVERPCFQWAMDQALYQYEIVSGGVVSDYVYILLSEGI